MEEKKRYEIHIYDDICVDLYDNGVLDKSINDTYKLEELLNQQSKRLKELEEELDDAKRDYIPKLEFGLQRANKMGRDAEKENQQLKQQLLTFAHRISDQNEEILGLKQQLHDLPKKIVEDIEKNFTEYLPLKYKTGAGFYCRLNTILKKYGGEDE